MKQKVAGRPSKPPGAVNPLAVVIAAFFIVAILFEVFSSRDGEKEALADPAQAAIKAPSREELDKQPERLELIQKLTNAGVFLKVEKPGSLPYAWVTPTFNALDFPQKQRFISVVYAYHVTADPGATLVILKDSRTGKQIGTFSPSGGLDLD